MPDFMPVISSCWQALLFADFLVTGFNPHQISQLSYWEVTWP